MCEKTHNRSAFIAVLVPVAWTLLLAMFGAIAMSQGGSDGVYTVFIAISAVLMLLGPVALLVCGIVGNVHCSMAIRDRETRWKTAVLLTVSGLYTVGSVVLAVLMLKSLME